MPYDRYHGANVMNIHYPEALAGFKVACLPLLNWSGVLQLGMLQFFASGRWEEVRSVVSEIKDVEPEKIMTEPTKEFLKNCEYEFDKNIESYITFVLKKEEEEEKEAVEVEEKVEVKEEVEEAKEEEKKLDEFQRVLAKILAEKLTYYTKSKLLEKGIKLDEVNNIVSDLKEYIESLAEKIALKEITQKEAESEISKKIEELMRRRTEKIKPIIEAVESKLIYYARTKLLERGIEPSEANKILDEQLKAHIEELARKVALNEITQEEAERLIDSKIEEMPKIDFSSILEKLIEVYKGRLRELGYSEDKINEIIETLEEALKRVKGIPPPVVKPTVEVARPEVERVEFERPKRPRRKIIDVRYERDVLKVLIREWSCIVTYGVYDCLKMKEYIIMPQVSLNQLVTAFAQAARSVLHDRDPRTVREWFITSHCPIYNDVIRMIFTFGLNRENFIRWFKKVYEMYKPQLEELSEMKLPDFNKFYKDFKEFIINYKLL